MSILSQISKPENRPIIMTIFGDAGMGKTSLAATFPKPIFIRAEDGLMSIEQEKRPDAFPLVTKSDELWNQLAGLVNEEHAYKTLVIDSISALERMFIKEVAEEDPRAKGIIARSHGGYGAGFQMVGSMHERVRKAAGVLNTKKGMNVVFLAHAQVMTIDPPDGNPYSVYEMRLNGKYSSPPYQDDVDIVGFIRLDKFIESDAPKGGDKAPVGKARAVGEDRIIVCHAVPSNISKNRFGISEPISFKKDVNPFEGLIGGI